MIAIATAKDADAMAQAFIKAGENTTILGEVVAAGDGERVSYSGQLELGG